MIRWWQPFVCLAIVFTAAAAWDAWAYRMDTAKDRRRNADRAAWVEAGFTDDEADWLAP